MRRWTWRALPRCPGRYTLADAPPDLTPEGLAGDSIAWQEFHVPAARDPVLVAALPDGGLISYRRSSGRYVHTLNTEEGFRRKLEQLGIDHPR